MPHPDQELEEGLEPPQPSQPRQLEGHLPRFPSSTRPPRQSPQATAQDPGPAEPPPLPPPGPDTTFAGPGPEERSSPASTEPEELEEPVDPADLQAAITQVADIGFVLIGQALGRMEARARQLPAVDPKWVPTVEEREFVSAPAARIARRHVKAPKEAMDVVDGCLIAVGVGAFSVRGMTGVSPLDKKEA